MLYETEEKTFTRNTNTAVIGESFTFHIPAAVQIVGTAVARVEVRGIGAAEITFEVTP